MPALTLADGGKKDWAAVPDLFESGPGDKAVVVEVDDERVAWLRFGDGRTGAEPSPGCVLSANYRTGNGPVGNVGAGAIRYLVLEERTDTGVELYNPLPAEGGTEHEAVADAKMAIPAAFRAARQRAITADDYAELAQRIAGPAVQSTAAELAWAGSWYVAEVSLDPRGGATDAATVEKVVDGLRHYRRMGHEVEVRSAQLVPIVITLEVCVAPDVVAAHVTAALRDHHSAGVRRDGTWGFFHPDRWTFGQSVSASAIVAAAAGVPGVVTVDVTELARADRPGSDAMTASGDAEGVLVIGSQEIAALDPGPDRAVGGGLTITTLGGR